MVILPLQIARVSDLLQSTVATQNIDSTQAQLVQIEQQLTTGKQVNQASDNPSSAAVIQQLQKTLDYSAQYTLNITQGSDQLNEVDSTLGNVTSLLTQAQSIASANASSTVSADSRASAATIVDSIYNQLLTTANTQYQSTYLFGADDAAAQPYVATASGVQFNGSTNTLSNTFQQGTQLSFQVSGQQVFGGESASVSTGTDISPELRSTDRITDLSGATSKGVQLGSIQIGNGTTIATVDLTGDDSIGDVISDINAAGLTGVTASLTNTGIKLTASGGANISVNEVGGGSTAGDLGILKPTGAGAGVAVTGSDVGAKVTDFTPLSDLRGGAGLDATGFTLSNGTTSTTISLNGLTTVEDLVNAVNNSGIGARASINADGTGIDLVNAVQGDSLSVSENGGTTATELGFRTFSPTTSLSSLNDGNGVSTPSGNQFSITTADGTVTNIGLTSADTTVQNVLDAINTAAAGKVTASFATTGNGIVLTDNTTGSGKLAVNSINAASTAADLGITGTSSGGKIVGTDVNPVTAPGIFQSLQKLRDGLRSNNTAEITEAAGDLQTDSTRVTDINATVGARVQELTSRSNDLSTQTLANKTLMSTFQDVDYTTAVTKYQTLQTGLQASLEVTAKSLNISLLDYLS